MRRNIILFLFVWLIFLTVNAHSKASDNPSCCSSGYINVQSGYSVQENYNISSSTYEELPEIAVIYDKCTVYRTMEYRFSDQCDQYGCKVIGDLVTRNYSCQVNPCENGVPDEYGNCPVDCPPGSDYNITAETCQCKPGYGSSGFGDDLICTAPVCPAMYDSLPLFKVVNQPGDCNFLNMTDGSSLQRPDGKWCCYGQEDDLPEDNCPPNNIEINGECYPITPSPDDNSTPDDHTCPMGEYWSFQSNSCKPFYPDDNVTGDSGGSGGSGGSGDTSNSSGTSDNNGTIVIDDSAWFGGEISKDDYKGGLEGYANKSVDAVKDLLDSYVLISLPVNISGSCNGELSKTITVLGNSYTIDLSPHFQKLNNYNSMIYGLVMFVFGIGGVLMVAASGRSD